MSQISATSAKVKTIAADVTVTGAVLSGGLIQITGTHAYEVGDIVQISGIAGAVEANGQFVVASISTTVSFKLANATWAVTTYTSGGTVKHIGWATPAVLVDNTIFTASPYNFTLVSRVEALTSGANVRLVWVDSGVSTFVSEQPLSVNQAVGPVASNFSADKRFSVQNYDAPDARIGASGDNFRLKAYVSGGAGASVQFSAWVEK